MANPPRTVPEIRAESDPIDAQLRLAQRATIPEGLRHLVSLAKKWGVGDDLFRGEMVRRATAEELRELIGQVRPFEEMIRSHLESFGPLSVDSPMPDEAARLMYMLVACDEVLPEQLVEKEDAPDRRKVPEGNES